jgi:subtilisin family serine protease
MLGRRGLAGVVASLVLAVAAVAAAVAHGDSSSWADKVDSSVLEAAALGQVEFLVLLEEQADLSGAAALATKEEKGRYVFERLTRVAGASQAPVVAELDRLGAKHQEFWIVNTIWATGGLDVVQAIAALPEVDHVYAVGKGGLDRPVPGGTESASVVEAVGPSINHVGANQVWALGYTGQGVTVAGADTGVRWTHNVLKAKYRGWNAETQTATHDYNWFDGAHASVPTDCPVNSPAPCDDHGHGSHTVGTIVGDDGLGNQVGMAPGAKWIACKNMTEGFGVVPTYLECMQWLLAPTKLDRSAPDPSKAPHVVNNSWGCVEVCPPPILKAQVEASRAAGIVYVVSAGNEGSSCSTIAFPLAIYKPSFTVGATNATNDLIASFSSRGPVLTDVGELPHMKPNISAPGVGIRSATRTSDSAFANMSGTSMAGPHVAGLVALIISAKPSLAGNVDRIEDIIEQTAVPRSAGGCPVGAPATVPNNIYGWGRINALAAVQEATRNSPPLAVDDAATVLIDTPTRIDVVANDSDPDGDPLTVTEVSQGANGSVTNNGDGTVTYTPNLGFLGSDSFTYTIADDEGETDTATVSVTVRLPHQATAGGWLADSGGGKIHVGVDVEETASGGTGEFRLNDKAGNAKIAVAEIAFAGAVGPDCGSVSESPSSLEIHGTGTFNGAPASFRVCVQDNGAGASAADDLFYLTCTDGCAYETGSRTPDDGLDGGNVEVFRGDASVPAAAAEPEAASNEEPSTLILDPLLLSDGIVGQVQVLSVTVYGGGQQALGNASVTLTRTTSGGLELLSAVTDATGTATFLTVNPADAAEYIASAGGVQSNAIAIAPLG